MSDQYASGSDEGNNMAALGELISNLNPLTNLPSDSFTAKGTGDMQLEMLPSAKGQKGGRRDHSAAMIAVEIDNRAAYWSFKGHTEAVKSAARIPYRFPVFDKMGRTLYWQTESLFIGYSGADEHEPAGGRAERRAEEAERRADAAFQRAADAERLANEAHKRAESSPAPPGLPDSAPKHEAPSASVDPESVRVTNVVRAVSSSLATSRNLWEVIIGLQTGLQLTYEALSVPERIKNLGAELLLTAIYLIFFGWFALSHISSLSGLPQVASYFVPYAFADDKVHAPVVVKIVLLTLDSIGVLGILIMSGWASMLRKPPLQSAKEILRIALGFTTGQLTLAGFLT